VLKWERERERERERMAEREREIVGEMARERERERVNSNVNVKDAESRAETKVLEMRSWIIKKTSFSERKEKVCELEREKERKCLR
jgi:hypothetical protein